MKHVICIISFISLTGLFTPLVYSQNHPGNNNPAASADKLLGIDSMKTGLTAGMKESAAIFDSLRAKADTTGRVHTDSMKMDSVRVRFIPGMGQCIDDVDTADALHQTQFLWSDAKYLGELLWKLPGFFYRDLGEAGEWGQVNAFGADARGVSILLDGRPMNDPVTGTYNIYDLPIEFIDHSEIFSGYASMIPSDGTGMAMNFVSRSYNSYHPMTKLRFVQDPKGTILTDGLFTQNVARGLNLMIGFQRQVTMGRYKNTALDAWNVRTRLRYNISERLNIALTDFYTKSGEGLNGGILPGQVFDMSNEANSNVQCTNAWDKRSRRDVTLSAIARILSDSSSKTQTSIYYSTLYREYYLLDREYYLSGFFNRNSIDDFTKSSFWGMRLQQQLPFGPLRLTIGGYWERRQTDSTRTLPLHLESERSLFVQAEGRLTNLFTPSVFIRSTSLDGENTISTGMRLNSAVTDWLTVFGDVTWFDRFPTIQERYWTDSIIIRSGWIAKEQHTFFQGGLTFKAGSHFQMNLTGFQRIVKNAIVYQPASTANGSPAISISNVNEVQIIGLNGQASIHWGPLEVIGIMTLTRYQEGDTLRILIPDVIFSGEASYHDKFFKEKLDAKLGVRSRFFNRQNAMQFDPQTLSYIQYRNNIIGRSTTVDLFMVLKIGDAHVSLSMENIMNVPYILAPIYPMPGRYLRLGVNWVFMD